MNEHGEFVWVLHCPACHEQFSPVEDDWNDMITCPECYYEGLINHDWYGEDEGPPEGMVEIDVYVGDEPKPGDHPDWPSNLSDELLDKAYLAAGDLMPDKVVILLEEYQRRGRQPPGGSSA